MLTSRVFPFFRDPENVLSSEEVTFLHNKSSCFKALQTQELLQNNDIDFFSSSEFSGSFSDLNVCANIGSVLKDRFENQTVSYDGSLNDSQKEVIEMLKEVQFDS